jgi:DNA-binding MltR family transcriptional regulator
MEDAEIEELLEQFMHDVDETVDSCVDPLLEDDPVFQTQQSAGWIRSKNTK